MATIGRSDVDRSCSLKEKQAKRSTSRLYRQLVAEEVALETGHFDEDKSPVKLLSVKPRRHINPAILDFLPDSSVDPSFESEVGISVGDKRVMENGSVENLGTQNGEASQNSGQGAGGVWKEVSEPSAANQDPPALNSVDGKEGEPIEGNGEPAQNHNIEDTVSEETPRPEDSQGAGDAPSQEVETVKPDEPAPAETVEHVSEEPAPLVEPVNAVSEEPAPLVEPVNAVSEEPARAEETPNEEPAQIVNPGIEEPTESLQNQDSEISESKSEVVVESTTSSEVVTIEERPVEQQEIFEPVESQEQPIVESAPEPVHEEPTEAAVVEPDLQAAPPVEPQQSEPEVQEPASAEPVVDEGAKVVEEIQEIAETVAATEASPSEGAPAATSEGEQEETPRPKSFTEEVVDDVAFSVGPEQITQKTIVTKDEEGNEEAVTTITTRQSSSVEAVEDGERTIQSQSSFTEQTEKFVKEDGTVVEREVVTERTKISRTVEVVTTSDELHPEIVRESLFKPEGVPEEIEKAETSGHLESAPPEEPAGVEEEVIEPIKVEKKEQEIPDLFKETPEKKGDRKSRIFSFFSRKPNKEKERDHSKERKDKSPKSPKKDKKGKNKKGKKGKDKEGEAVPFPDSPGSEDPESPTTPVSPTSTESEGKETSEEEPISPKTPIQIIYTIQHQISKETAADPKSPEPFRPIEAEDDKTPASEDMQSPEEIIQPQASGNVESTPESKSPSEQSEERPKSATMPEKKSHKGFFKRPKSLFQSSPKNQPSTSYLNAPVQGPNDSFDSAIARSHRSSVDSGTASDPSRSSPGHFVVVAIDFGTTFSGYAFSFTRDPESIHMMRKWEGGDPGVINQKTPTCLLLTPEGKFHSFGFTARDMFHDLDPQEAKKWLYFDKFKMALHYSTELNKDTPLRATNGKEVPAITVFSHSLRFFKDHALQELSDQSATKIMNEDIRWVITVPAIWKAPAKQFMRQAAYEAGIASPQYPDQLLIALEPEAASIYCRKLRMHQLVPENPVEKYATYPRVKNKIDSADSSNMDRVSDDFVSGMRYMVVDCGGGTVDITVHEMESSHGNLKELFKATGGPYGSVGVDLEFEKLLVNIFGAEFIDAYKMKRPAGYIDLMIAFESRKRAANPMKPNPLNVSLPFSFIDFYKKHRSSQVDSAVRKYGDSEVRWSSQGMLRLTNEAMRRLFFGTVENIKRSIGEVLNNPTVKDIKYMFLVGGFGESRILQVELRKEFGHLLKIIIPQEVGLTILKGAVCYGLDPTVVTVRKSRMTYGVGVLNRYNKDKHPKKKLVEKDGAQWCTDVFDKFVEADQSIALGDTVLRSYTPAKPGQTSSVINIYCSEKKEVKFITDHGVKKCGTLHLDLSDMQYTGLPKRREIQTRMTFGDTEMKLTALDVATGTCVRASIDFLNK